MSFIKVSQAKNYYRSFKPLVDRQAKQGSSMLLGVASKPPKALSVCKVKPVRPVQLKGGLS